MVNDAEDQPRCWDGKCVIVCIDANARVVSVEAEGVLGCMNSSKVHDNGCRLRTATSSLSLVAVNTFVQAQPTWVSSFGTGH